MSGDGAAGELHLAPESIEALALRLAEVLAAADGSPPEERGELVMISAAEVARRWGVARRWVYDHAEALGAVPLGSGSRPRLRFDPEEVAERLGAPLRRGGLGDGRRLTARARFPHPDWLSGRSGAMFAESQIAVAGRAKAPGPVPKEVPRHAPDPRASGPPSATPD